MANVSKIRKYGLEEEAQQLKEMGYSYQDIANTLKNNHPKIEDLKSLSNMSVMRYFDTETENTVVEIVETGGNPVSDLVLEFQNEIRDIHRKSERLAIRAEKILDKIEGGKDDALKLKALKETRDSYDQLRKNYESLLRFGDNRIKSIQNVNLKKEVHVKNMLVGLTKNLCDECRRKISEELEKFL